MEIKYNNATIYIYGDVNRKTIEEATIIFMNNIQRRNQNGNDNKTRTIKKK